MREFQSARWLEWGSLCLPPLPPGRRPGERPAAASKSPARLSLSPAPDRLIGEQGFHTLPVITGAIFLARGGGGGGKMRSVSEEQGPELIELREIAAGSWRRKQACPRAGLRLPHSQAQWHFMQFPFSSAARQADTKQFGMKMNLYP